MSDGMRRITTCERESMDATIRRYLTRHVVSYGECPHYESLRDLHLAGLPDYILPTWHAMRQWYATIKQRPPALDQSSAAAAQVRFPSGHVLLLQHTVLRANERFEPVLGVSTTALQVVDATDVLGAERAAELEEWATGACQLVRRVQRSYETADRILDLASTVGQLHRMCPDLVRYVFPQTAAALKTQQRRSPIPDDWMKVDRTLVADMVNHLALCYLLPDVTYQTQDFRSVIDGWCWAFDRASLRYSSYSCQLRARLEQLSLCDGDGNWQDP